MILTEKGKTKNKNETKNTKDMYPSMNYGVYLT